MPTYDTSDRHGLRALTGANVVADIDEGFRALRDDVSAKMATFDAGPLSSRPPSTPSEPGIVGRRYYSTDTGQEFLDVGTGWEEPGFAPGELKVTARKIVPEGWLRCSAQQITNVPAQARLRAALIADGQPWGTAAGNPLAPPADRALVAAVAAGSHATGALFGEATHALALSELPGGVGQFVTTGGGSNGGQPLLLVEGGDGSNNDYGFRGHGPATGDKLNVTQLSMAVGLLIKL